MALLDGSLDDIVDDATLAAFGRNVAFLARTIEASLGPMSLTAYRVLTLIDQGDERSSQIAGRLAVGRPTVTYAVDALVEKGLLTREPVEGDRRVVRLALTKEGRAALARADASIAAWMRRVFDQLDDPDGAAQAVRAVQAANLHVGNEWAARRSKRAGS